MPKMARVFPSAFNRSQLIFQKRQMFSKTYPTKKKPLTGLETPFTKCNETEAETNAVYLDTRLNLKRFLKEEFHSKSLQIVSNSALRAVENIIQENSKDLRPWGLIISLLSKSIQKAPETPNAKSIEENQINLAILVEMLKTSNFLHKTIANFPYNQRNQGDKSIYMRNKISLLLGDYLLSIAHNKLANLRNSDVLYIISTAVKDLAQEEFIGERDKHNQPFPGKPKKQTEDCNITLNKNYIQMGEIMDDPINEWTMRTFHNGVCLLGKGCEAAMILGKQNKHVSNYAYNFGCHVGLAWQAANEIKTITSKGKDHFCLASAPVIFALETDPDMYKIIEHAKDDSKNVHYEELKASVLKTDAVDKTMKLYEHHAVKAIALIENLSHNECVDVVKKLIIGF